MIETPMEPTRSVVGEEEQSPEVTNAQGLPPTKDHSSHKTATSVAASGPAVPGYVIQMELGRGGMGVVYQARDVRLNRLVALKMILAGTYAGDSELRRFQTEAEAVARIQHPNIVQIFEVGTHNGLPFFAMEYCAGGTLARRLNGIPISSELAARLAQTLAQAIGVAHAVGVIHRDLKPGNILLSQPASISGAPSTAAQMATPNVVAVPSTHPDQAKSRTLETEFGIPKIGDFGLAKLLDSPDTKTRTGAVLGTPSYMAPEQAFGDALNVGYQTDVYSVGAILYELLTGRPPFRGVTTADTLDQVRRNEPIAPRLLAKVPRDLETICLKALQKDLSKRYRSANELAEDLGRFLDNRPIVARPVGMMGRLQRWVRRNPKVAALIATVAFLLLLVTVVSVTSALSLQSKNKAIEQLLHQEKEARQLATQERQQANAQANRNIQLVKFILFDVSARLREGGLSKTREAVLSRTFQQLEQWPIKDGEEGRVAERGRISIAVQMGDLYLSRALTEEGPERQKAFTAAKGHFIRANEAAKRLVELEPDSPRAKGNLGLTHSYLGLMYLRAQALDKAKVEYEESLRLRQDVLENPGPNGGEDSLALADVRRSLADSYAGLAQIALLQKEKALADRYLTRILELRTEALQLVEQDPSHTIQPDGVVPFRRDLAASQIQQARDLLGINTPEAFQQGKALLTQAQTLLAGGMETDDLITQRDLARVIALLGDNLLFYTQQHADALKQYQQSMAILKQVLQKEDSREVQAEAAMGHYRLGTAYLRLKQYANASTEYKACLAIREAHHKANPTERSAATLMIALARAGEVNRAIELLEKQRPQTTMKEEFPFVSACTYAICAWSIGDWQADEHLTPDQKAKRTDYTTKALADVQTLFQIRSRWAKKVETDPDLEFLHSRPEFLAIVLKFKKQ